MHAPAQGAASVVRTERHKILVVEDEQDFRETLAALLETHGFDALQAANGAEGIELARQNRPDLIICDIHMSGVNGYGALEALRSRTDTATIPFIFLTGDRDPSGLRRGMESGADDYLLKPVAPETLLATIRARLTKLDAQRRQEHETHARLLAVFEATPDLIAVAELEDRHITYINRAGLRILGVPRADDIASLHLQNLFTPAAWTHLRDAALPATQRDGNWLGESALLALDGHEVPVSLVLLRHPAAAGQGGYFSLIARDISEGKRLQSELSHERDLLSALMDIVREQIVFKDREGRFMRANKAAAERLGLDEPAQVAGKSDADFFTPAQVQRNRAMELEVLEKGRGQARSDESEEWRDGRMTWSHARTLPFHDQHGRIIGTITLGRDFTATRHVQDALRRSEHLLDVIMENTADLVAVVDTEGRFHFTSPSYQKVLEHTQEELQKLGAFGLVHPEDRADVEAAVRGTLASGFEHVIEYRIHARGGRCLTLESRGVVLRNEQGAVENLLTVARDITGRKRAELELRASFKETEALLASLSAILIGVDQNGRIARWNPAAETAFGLNTSQAIGHLFFESGIQWDWEPVRKGIIECLVNHRSVELGDVTYKRADGRDGAMHLIATPGASESAHRLHFILLGLDTTQRHQLEAQLRQAQKLESIGQLAAGIAHEINTPTQFIGDNLRFMQDSFGELKKALDELQKFLALTYGTPEAFDALKHVKDALAAADIGYLSGEFPKAIAQSLEGTERVAKIVRAMKEFSHPDVGGRTPVNLNRAIESTVAVATNEWKYHAEVVTKLDPDLPDVPCFPGDINQVILNLVVNAAHAIASTPAARAGQKGTITVSTRQDGDTVELRIADTGTGIPEKFRGRVFDPFFTTKEVGKGTGQGLFIAHNVVVEKHGGTIDIETEESKGTTFVVRLPLNPPAKKTNGAQ